MGPAVVFGEFAAYLLFMTTAMRSSSIGGRLALAAALIGILVVPGIPVAADDDGSRILNSPSRSTVYRGQPETRSLRPGSDRSVSRSLSGMVGDLEAAGGPRSMDDSRVGGSRVNDCVLHHERLERNARQLFPTYCNPAADVDTGYPAFTTR